MALIACSACGREISPAALTCPNCGNPNKKAQHSQQHQKQAVGCGFIVLSVILWAFFGPIVGGITFAVGLVLVLLNTRLY